METRTAITKTRWGVTVGLVLMALSPVPGSAEESARYGSLGLGIGTGGLGIDYAYPLHRLLDVRAGYDFGKIKKNTEEDGVDYDAELKFSSARLLLDYKPFGGGFRISAGLYTGAPELELHAQGDDDYELGENDYNGDLTADGKIDLGGAAPYLGLGWGGTASTTGFGASFDVGVIFTGSPKVTLRVPDGRACLANDDEDCDPQADGFDVNDGSPEALAFQADVDLEREEVEDDARDFKLWPILRIGLHYRF